MGFLLGGNCTLAVFVSFAVGGVGTTGLALGFVWLFYDRQVEAKELTSQEVLDHLFIVE